MNSHYFLRFVLRRCQCATVLFLGVLATLYVSTSVYYAIRIGVVERPGALDKTQAVETLDFEAQPFVQGAGSQGEDMGHHSIQYPPANAAQGHHKTDNHSNHSSSGSSSTEGVPDRTADTAAAAGAHTTLAPRQALRRSSKEPYELPYKVLLPSTPMMQQQVRNPTLPAEVPVWETGEGSAAGRRAVPSRQRYVLDGLAAGDRYMLRLSYLGSPSVGFNMRLYQVRRSEVQRFASAAPAARRFEAAPQDTELLVFTASQHSARLFSAEENVWLDKGSTGGDAPFDPVAMRRVLDEAAESEDFFVPVVEVRTRVLSIPVDAHRLPIVRFNIELDRMRPPFLPSCAVPVMTYTVWALIFLGYVGIYTFVSSGIAGGEPVKPHDE